MDVDDLMYLSRVLDVTPLTLLLPAYVEAGETAELTAYGNGMARAMWQWALGHHDPTDGYASDDATPTRSPRSDSEFRAAVLPREMADLLGEIFAAVDQVEELKQAGAQVSAIERNRAETIQRQIQELTALVKTQQGQLDSIQEQIGG